MPVPRPSNNLFSVWPEVDSFFQNVMVNALYVIQESDTLEGDADFWL